MQKSERERRKRERREEEREEEERGASSGICSRGGDMERVSRKFCGLGGGSASARARAFEFVATSRTRGASRQHAYASRSSTGGRGERERERGVVFVRSLVDATRSGGQTALTPCAVVKRGKVNLFEQSKNPIIYGGAVDRLEDGHERVGPGNPVFVSDWKNRLLGWGFFNPSSMYRVRVMEYVSSSSDFEEDLSHERISRFLYSRIRDACEAREKLGLPSSDTDVYRLINSEGDNLSGIVVDRMGKNLVVQSSGAWVQLFKQVILKALVEVAGGTEFIAWKTDLGILKKEGVADIDKDFELFKVDSNESGTVSFQNLSSSSEQGEDSFLPGDHEVVVRENSATYLVRLNMQKTGFYCDQRENRSFLRSLSKGKTCLDLCCYTGGFSIAAALGGATDVVGVDSSASAIAIAEENAKLNGVDAKFQAEDISKFMRRHIEQGKQWDVVVLDPPKLCPSAKFLKPALRKYEKLNTMAMSLVARGGILMTCSCSGAVTRSDKFMIMLNNAAARAGRDVKILRVSGASDCHMTSLRYPEGNYLTVITLMIM